MRASKRRHLPREQREIERRNSASPANSDAWRSWHARSRCRIHRQWHQPLVAQNLANLAATVGLDNAFFLASTRIEGDVFVGGHEPVSLPA